MPLPFPHQLLQLATLSFAFTLACAAPAPPKTAPKPSAKAAKPPKLSIVQMLKRERPVMPKQRVAGPKAAFSGEVEALGKPKIQKVDKNYYIAVPIGTAAPLECYLFPHVIDVATSLRGMVQKLSKGAKKREPIRVSSGLVGGTPAIRLVAPFVVHRKGKAVLMMLKMAAFSYPYGGLICMHNEVGYPATFTRIVDRFAASLELPWSRPLTDFDYVNIGVVRVGKLSVGFIKTLETKKGSRTKSQEIMSMLIPMKDGSLFASEAASNSTFQAGELLDETRAAALNGALKYRLTLRRIKKGSYAVKGRKEGKPINLTFSAKKPLYSDPTQGKLIRKHFIDKASTSPIVLWDYLPQRDAASLSPVKHMKIRALSTDGDLTIQSESEKRTITRKTLDRDGRPKRVHLRLGLLDVQVERHLSRTKP